jgi:peptidyl-prolyl cis-trans isomerase C
MMRLGLWIAGFSALAGIALAQTDPAPPSPPRLLIEGFQTLSDLAANLEQLGGNVAVMVDGTPITNGDIADEIRTFPASYGSLPMSNVYQLAMENLMRQRALALRASREGVDKDPAAQRRLAIAADKALVLEYMRREVTPRLTEQALRARYDATYVGRPGPIEVRGRVIVLPTREAALEAAARLRLKPDFAALAREISRDASAAAGGDLGYVPQEALDPAVAAVLFALNPGDVAPNPVRGAQGWFIIRNEGSRQQGAPPFEAMRERLRRDMAAEAMAAIRATITARITAEPGQTPSVETLPAK